MPGGHVRQNGLIKLFAVLLTEVNLELPAVDAEPPGHVLAFRNLFLVEVTGICDRKLLCHVNSPFPWLNIYPPPGLLTNDTPGQGPDRRVRPQAATR